MSGHLLYSLQLAGINCTNCQAKIKNNLTQKVKTGLVKVSVIILQQKVNLIIENQTTLIDCINVLKQLGYSVIDQPLLIEGGDQNIRTISFLYQIAQSTQKLQETIRNMPGVNSIYRTHTGSSIKITVNYDCRVIKGRQIADLIKSKDQNYKTINHKVESFKKVTNAKKNQGPTIRTTFFLCFFFIILDMILPLTGQWFHSISTFPTSFGPFTIIVIINVVVALYTLNIYARPCIQRAFQNYTTNGSMDMETLISLGCSSAFFLFCFFMTKYTIQFVYGGLEEPAKSVMEINDALASSCIIVLVVTIGKYFQRKVKDKIQAMTSKLFPQSTLFEDMNVTFVRLKNRKLAIQSKQTYDISLLEKDDIIEVQGGKRLLADIIILSGQFQAVKSTIDGNDETKVFAKGDRIESGSIIVSSTKDALMQIQNVFQKSMLIEIGTHIKMGQNQDQANQSGIQAVCKTVSRYFVKTVILISILVMVSWFFLLSFEYVKVPSCNFCWIVQRGIGVLVASCPCALGLAVPSVLAILLNIAIKNGILIRNCGVLEKMKKCKVISFDKTGTLFTRINKIEQHYVFQETFPQKILWQIITVIEKPIKHPIAEVLYKEAYNKSEIQGTNFQVLLNKHPIVRKQGIQAQVLHKKQNQVFKVLFGNKNILKNSGISIPDYTKKSKGTTELFLALNDQVYMVLVLNTHSNLRPEAATVISLLMESKKQVHILSGDSRQSVQNLGHSLRIPMVNLHPEHSSEMKMQWIKQIQKDLESDDGIGVIMVGDGLNDIPCLQQASIGISINAKSQLNINVADVIMLSEDLFKILTFVKLLRRGNQFINANLFWAFIYNLTIMPVVAGAFYNYNITISPVWSSIAMSCSSILVVSFSHLMSFFEYDVSKKYKPKPKMIQQDSTDYSEIKQLNKLEEFNNNRVSSSRGFEKKEKYYNLQQQA